MATLPVKKIILYKHGVGYFERRGSVSGEQVRLSFPRPAMDDMLKSLVALDTGAGHVLSVDFETPEDRKALLDKGSIHLSANHSMLDLLRDLRGRRVRCLVVQEEVDEQTGIPVPRDDIEIEGLVVGAEAHETRDGQEKMGFGSKLLIYQQDEARVRVIEVHKLHNLVILDDKATDDLTYFLRASQSEEEHRSATLHLTPGEHDLLVGYIAPAPAWRVSYRLLFEPETEQARQEPPPANLEPGREQMTTTTGTACTVLLQGWGLFDNQLEEDLEAVRLTLVAGMPVSFRYRLYEPHTPERPLVQDEERTVNAPMFFEGAPPPAPAAAAAPQATRARKAGGRDAKLGLVYTGAQEEAEMMDMAAAEPTLSAADMEEAVEITTSGSERGALFAYEVGHPVSVGRGQSAMVPIISRRMDCRRELLYNGRKLPQHPVASLRMHNETGLTLERGPVTVLEEGDYAGEAVVPFTRADAELIVPFAVELGIKVEEKRNGERQLIGISIRHGYLHLQEFDVQHTTYHLTSTLSKAVDVTIEHARRNNYELADTPAPAEQGASFARWQVACAANTRTVFAVHERRLMSRREEVRSLTGQRLQRYLQDKLLDAATVRALEEVLHVYSQVSETQQQVKRVQQERDAIYKQQKQIQGNLGPLSHQGEEGKLRARYVAELNRLEDRLKNLDTEEQRLKQRIDELERQAQAKLQALSTEE